VLNVHLFYFHCLVILCLISKFWKSSITQFKMIFLKSLCVIFIIYRLLGRRPHVGLHGFCFVALTFLAQYKMSSFIINTWLMLFYFLSFTDCLQKNQPIGLVFKCGIPMLRFYTQSTHFLRQSVIVGEVL
jgi:hypothetical protein